MKSKLYTDAFPWKCKENSEDYIFCTVGEYFLTVQKEINHWWWVVYFDGTLIKARPNNASSKYRAVGLAEGTYLGHSAHIFETRSK